MVTSPDFELFTSLRWDPALLKAEYNTQVAGEPSPYVLFPYHFDRLVDAAKGFGWPAAIDTMKAPNAMAALKMVCDQAVERHTGTDKETNGLRLRVYLSSKGVISAEAFPCSPLVEDGMGALRLNPSSPLPDTLLPHPILAVQLDTEPTPSSSFTAYKTTSRAHYDAARLRAGILDRSEPREVILWNEHGELTESSFRNVAFWRDGGWMAPDKSSGGLPGTVRRWLMEKGLLREGKIHKDDVKPGEWVLLSNGVDVTILGRMVDKSSA